MMRISKNYFCGNGSVESADNRDAAKHSTGEIRVNWGPVQLRARGCRLLRARRLSSSFKSVWLANNAKIVIGCVLYTPSGLYIYLIVDRIDVDKVACFKDEWQDINLPTHSQDSSIWILLRWSCVQPTTHHQLNIGSSKSPHGRLHLTHNFCHGAIWLGFDLSNVAPIGEQKCICCFGLFNDFSDRRNIKLSVSR